MLVLGNGQSRKDVDLNNIEDIKIGCNAIHRDFFVDHLVCIDRRMVNEALEANYNQHSKIYTREEWFDGYPKTKNLRVVPNLPYVGSDKWDEPFHWGSGPYAVLLSATLCKGSTVRLLGFDLYSPTSRVNNIYKGTNNYDSEHKRAVDPRYWIYQIGMVFHYFPKINFVIHNDDFDLPPAWKKSNVKVDSISNIV